MIPLYLKTADFQEPRDLLYYLLASNGIFLVKNNALFRSVSAAPGIAGLASQEPETTLNFPKLPRELMEQVYGFFEFVFRKWEGEAVALLYYSLESGEFRVGIPPQKIFRYRGLRHWHTEGRVEYGYLPRPESFLKMGDIHSHPDTSAFFSRTDDYDDAEDGLHIVMGNLHRPPPDLRVSFVAGGTRFRLVTENVVESFGKPIPPPAEWVSQVVCECEDAGKPLRRSSWSSHA